MQVGLASITDLNVDAALQLWHHDPLVAVETFGDITTWDLSAVSDGQAKTAAIEILISEFRKVLDEQAAQIGQCETWMANVKQENEDLKARSAAAEAKLQRCCNSTASILSAVSQASESADEPMAHLVPALTSPHGACHSSISFLHRSSASLVLV